ncbi:MAG: mechanosensitive ion channel family protein [Acidobacteriaceae bacterium]
MSHLLHLWHGWFLAIFLLCTAIVFSNAAHFVLFRLLRRKKTLTKRFGLGIQKHLQAPARWVFILTCVLLTLPSVPLAESFMGILRQTLQILLVIVLGWLAIGFVYVLENMLIRRFDITTADNIRARRVYTQTQLMRRILIAFVVVLDIGCLLWTFHDPRIWHYGTGLVASAGLASLVLATAAKSTASNFLAGMQIAITEPIRIDDVVIVEGEWGRIEEITTSYVVVKIWDLRRLIVPLSYFIEHPFQNWTRETADLLGTTFLYVDYSVPVEPLRQHLTKIVSASPLWDGKVCGLQVTNLSEHTMELRCLMSSSDASKSFDLRCYVREEMVHYIQQNYPDAFPRTRFAAIPTKHADSGSSNMPLTNV